MAKQPANTWGATRHRPWSEGPSSQDCPKCGRKIVPGQPERPLLLAGGRRVPSHDECAAIVSGERRPMAYPRVEATTAGVAVLDNRRRRRELGRL